MVSNNDIFGTGHSFDALSKLRIQTDESLEEKIRQITSLSDDYKLLWKPAKQYGSFSIFHFKLCTILM